MRKYSKYVAVAGALAALAAPSAAMAGGTGAASTCLNTLPNGTPLPNGLNAAVAGTAVADGATVNAGGCDIGVYDPTGNLSHVTVTGAKQYGVYVDSGSVNVTGGSVNTIGDQPFDGMQYGDGIYYANGANGAISGVTVTNYQKNGIVATGGGTSVSVTGNTVTGRGIVPDIAQNGIVIMDGASATAMTGNIVSDNHYGGHGWTATGILFYEAQDAPTVGAISSANTLFQNKKDIAVVK